MAMAKSSFMKAHKSEMDLLSLAGHIWMAVDRPRSRGASAHLNVGIAALFWQRFLWGLSVSGC
jgi:hypothetical protein